MAIKVSAAESIVCPMCGKAYPKRQSNFAVYHSPMYNGTGYLNICKDCLNVLFEVYVKQIGDTRKAIRQVCRKLDIYYSDEIYEQAQSVSAGRSMIAAYMTKVNKMTYNGKTYDDTLREEGTLWSMSEPQPAPESLAEYEEKRLKDIPESVIAFWGPGYTADMYEELEQRRAVWMAQYPNNGKDLDVGTEALIRQICNLEIDINRDRSAGKPIDKNVNALNNLLGSAQLRPAQKKDDGSSLNEIPFGVGIGWCERHKPIAEPDEEFRDVDGIRRYISVWLYGHLAKMMGKKNLYSKLYEDEIARLRVDHPEYMDEDDEDFITDVLSEEDDGGDA